MLLVAVLVGLLWVVVAIPATFFFVGAVTTRRAEARPRADEHPIWLLERSDADGDAVYAMEDGHRIRVRTADPGSSAGPKSSKR